jgi:hypothetical protein
MGKSGFDVDQKAVRDMMESERRFWRDDAGKVERAVGDGFD